jgi:hypothetical protein
MRITPYPVRVPSRLYIADQNWMRQLKRPRGIVIHSGDKGKDLATAAKNMGIS